MECKVHPRLQWVKDSIQTKENGHLKRAWATLPPGMEIMIIMIMVIVIHKSSKDTKATVFNLSVYRSSSHKFLFISRVQGLYGKLWTKREVHGP